MRINKFIAQSGLCSRRKADELIKEGKVSVNGKKTLELGTEINESNDTVLVEGKRVMPVQRFTYVMLNKPKSVICSNKDELERKTVFDFVKDLSEKRLFCVGRLDYDTEGLVILTNDGNTANKLTHPSNNVSKTYIVKIKGQLSQEEQNKIKRGVKLEDGTKLQGARVNILETDAEGSKLELVIFEGKNHEIKNIFAAISKELIFLKRIAIGEIRLGGLTRGTYRYLNEKEIKYLMNLKQAKKE